MQRFRWWCRQYMKFMSKRERDNHKCFKKTIGLTKRDIKKGRTYKCPKLDKVYE